jgi:hypothetical protein
MRKSITRGARIKNKLKQRPSSKKKKDHGNKKRSLSPKEWNGRMKDIPCFILGNAPSLNNVNVSLLDNYFTVGINRIFYKYDPTILIWQDLALWTQEKNKVLDTKAIKYCRESSETKGGFYIFKLKGREATLSHSTETLYGRGSSGSIAYQFVHALGCNPIILVGMDCRYDKKTKLTDFYGNNKMHRQHTLPACVKGLKFIRDNSKGKTIINCSKNKVFKERFTIEEAIEKLEEKKYNREELTNILLKN